LALVCGLVQREYESSLWGYGSFTDKKLYRKKAFQMSEKFYFEYVDAFDKGRRSTLIVGQGDKTCTDLQVCMSVKSLRDTDDSVKTAIRRKRGMR
jgi:hypothetical protein